MRRREGEHRQSSLPRSLIRHLRSGPQAPAPDTSDDEGASMHRETPPPPPQASTSTSTPFALRPIAPAPALAPAPPAPAPALPLRHSPAHPPDDPHPHPHRSSSAAHPHPHPHHSGRAGSSDDGPPRQDEPHAPPHRQASPWGSTDPAYYTYPPPAPRDATPYWAWGEQARGGYWDAGAGAWPGVLPIERAESFSRGEGYDQQPARFEPEARFEALEQAHAHAPQRAAPLAHPRVAQVMAGWRGAEYGAGQYQNLPQSVLQQQQQQQQQPSQFSAAFHEQSSAFQETGPHAFDPGRFARAGPSAHVSPYLMHASTSYGLSATTTPRAEALRLSPGVLPPEHRDPFFGQAFPFGSPIAVETPPPVKIELEGSPASSREKGKGRAEEEEEEGVSVSASQEPEGAKARGKTDIACAFCRMRKLKCSGERPACSACQKRGLVCEYAAQRRRRGPGKALKGTRKLGGKGRGQTQTQTTPDPTTALEPAAFALGGAIAYSQSETLFPPVPSLLEEPGPSHPPAATGATPRRARGRGRTSRRSRAAGAPVERQNADQNDPGGGPDLQFSEREPHLP